MTATTLARAAGVLGGLCWVVQAVVDTGSGPEGLVNALHYGGLALLVIALLGIGAGLVSGLAALRVVVAVCLVALAWAVLEFGHEQASDRVVDAVLGGLVALYCVLGLVSGRQRGDDASPRASGSHAA